MSVLMGKEGGKGEGGGGGGGGLKPRHKPCN